MSYTAGFSVNVGDPTKASDVTTLAANDDYLKAAVDGKAALSGSTNNTVATVTGANALIGEADLTFASNKLTVFGTTGTGTATAGVLNLSTRETTVVDADQLGRIDFQAPAETGADAILVTASIYAEADVTFDATNNATDIVFATAHDGAAAERLRITSQGEIGLAGANYGTDGQVMTSAGAGAAAAWETIPPGTTLSGSTDNTVATVTGANALQGEANLTFDGSVLAVTGTADVSGDFTAGTVNADGDTSAGDNAAMGYTAAEGLILTGQGSTSDITIKNDADATVMSVATGGTQTKFTGTGNIVSLTGASGTEASMNFTPAANNAWQLGAGPLTAATFQLYENGAGAARITVKEGGNVGIGTTDPDAAAPTGSSSPKILKVDGGTGVDAAVQIVGHNNDHGLDLWTDVSTGDVYFDQRGNHTDYDMVFRTRTTGTPVNALIINGAGTVGVILSQAGGHTFNVHNYNASNPSGMQVYFGGVSSGDTTDYFGIFGDTGATRAIHYSNGNWVNANNSYGSTSDVKLKQDIVDAPGYWDDFKALQYRKFRLKEEVAQDENAGTKIGLIAQEIEGAFSKLVENSPDRAMQDVPVLDEDGNATYKLDDNNEPQLDGDGNRIPATEEKFVDLGTTTKSIKYSVLHGPVMATVVQELQTRLEAAEAKIAAMESA